jgi:hypothetical protein
MFMPLAKNILWTWRNGGCNNNACVIIKPTNVKNIRKPYKVHEYTNEDKCFKRNSNYNSNEVELQWLRLVLWEEKLLEEFLGFTTKHVSSNLNQQVLERDG